MSLPMENNVSSIILRYHPWEAKGPAYLAKSRRAKDEMLWDLITQDTTM